MRGLDSGELPEVGRSEARFSEGTAILKMLIGCPRDRRLVFDADADADAKSLKVKAGIGNLKRDRRREVISGALSGASLEGLWVSGSQPRCETNIVTNSLPRLCESALRVRPLNFRIATNLPNTAMLPSGGMLVDKVSTPSGPFGF